ncbi:MAG TPA: cyclase family protein [Burkholderiales bacterium]|nr:cyclase family protein [Burkholderiales bacterium]
MSTLRLCLLASTASLLLSSALAFSQTPTPAHISKADFEQMMKDLSNWGRWGKDDQLGTVNLITPAKRKAAAKLVTEGVSVSLSRDTDSVKGVDNGMPFVDKMSPPVDGQFNMDEYTVFFHGFAVTHIDALSHVFYKDHMYNNFSQTEIQPDGAKKLAIAALKDGIFTRGVLVDIPWLRGVPYLENDVVIYPSDLDAWEKKTGIRIESGDVVFVRTGRWAQRAAKGPWEIGNASAGLDPRSIAWFKKRDIAMLGGDAASDALPSGLGEIDFPVHQLLLVAMGTPMFDQCDLEPLAKAAAERKRWTFLFTAAPLRVTGGTGAPINPIATF